jgi:6-phosphogluconolactonase (cycloisomerase 2 family)
MIFKSFIVAVFLLLIAGDNLAQGKFVYVDNLGNSTHTVSGFSVDSNGVLSPLAGFPVATGGISHSGGNRLKISPSGKFIFVSNDDNATVSVFRINSTDGSLTLVTGSPFATNTGSLGSLSFELSPDERFLFAGNSGRSKIAVFNIAADGFLTPVQNSPFNSVAGGDFGTLKISPNGKFLFWNRLISESIATYSVAADGALTPAPNFLFFIDSDLYDDIFSLEINCAGTQLFVGTEGGYVAVLNIAPNGNLSHVSGSPFHLSNGLLTIKLGADDKTLFAGNVYTARVLSFSVSDSGVISLTPTSNIFIGDTNNEDRRPIDLDVNQNGSLLYVLNSNSEVLPFQIAQDGSLSAVQGSPFTNPGGSGGGATIAAFPPKTCAASISFDRCIQDESGNRILKINSVTGDYLFLTCEGTTIAGKGLIRTRGCSLILEDFKADRRVKASFDDCTAKATASLQIIPANRTYALIDRNMNDSTCACR